MRYAVAISLRRQEQNEIEIRTHIAVQDAVSSAEAVGIVLERALVANTGFNVGHFVTKDIDDE